MGHEGVVGEAARTPHSHEVWVPMGGSLFSPAGSPNKALPPQFTSPNEKVVYELEAGKLQRSLPAVAALAACLLGWGHPARHGSSPLPLHPRCLAHELWQVARQIVWGASSQC